MGALEELEQLAEEHKEIKGIKEIVTKLKMAEDAFDTKMPESEIEDLLEYFKAKFSDNSQLEQLEVDNKFKLKQIKNLISVMDLEYEEWVELETLMRKMDQLMEKNKKVEILSERLIVYERFTDLLDEIFQVILLRAGQ